MTRTGAAIEARDLTKTYGKDVRALDGLGFSVEAGTVFGLLGPNGAGKSTTVKILTTLSLPDSGQARVAGIDVLAEPDRVRRAIGLVDQRSGVDLEATGRENLTLQGQVHGLRGAQLRARVGDLLGRFGLAEAADRVARGYSGGMQRRLDIAMGLIHRPRVLFLDEPTTGLDPEVRADMWAEIAHLSAAEGLTILLTTHYLEEADRLAGRLAIVDRGRVVAEGSPDELKGELLGDAIHPTTPNLGQGGCLAIEDAFVLARCFAKYGATEEALRRYEQRRYKRTTALSRYSRSYGSIGQWERANGLRRTALSLMPEALARRLMQIVFDYDATRVEL